MELAARIGQSLLKKNKTLTERNELLEEQVEHIREEVRTAGLGVVREVGWEHGQVWQDLYWENPDLTCRLPMLGPGAVQHCGLQSSLYKLSATLWPVFFLVELPYSS